LIARAIVGTVTKKKKKAVGKNNGLLRNISASDLDRKIRVVEQNPQWTCLLAAICANKAGGWLDFRI
jgi:hypothetical protein